MNKYDYGEKVTHEDMNLALDGAKMFKFEEFIDDTSLSSITIANKIDAVSFPATGTPKGTLKLDLRNFNILEDIMLVATYCMSTAVGVSVVKLQNSYKIYNDADDLTDFTVVTNSEEFSVPATARTKINQIFTTLKIPYTALTNINDFILFELERLNTGLTGTNHTGNFELISLIAYQ